MVKFTLLFLVLAFAAIAINGAPLDRGRQKDEQSQNVSKLSPFGGSAQDLFGKFAPSWWRLIFGGKDPASQLAPAGKDPNRSEFSQTGLFDNQAQLESGPGVGYNEGSYQKTKGPHPDDRTEKKE
ncbi:hypothetical protein [Absidia glauca]|uniref:Secreted protein n=1 Tax=Absidia glauca TaxID=4829 RepID=A0A168PUS2_ABSGL|nr:hypothetical protein [Absidia glauca]